MNIKQSLPKTKPNCRFVFMVRCSDGSLYADITDNVSLALKLIKSGTFNIYTKSRNPVFLAYVEEYMNERDAKFRLQKIRRLSRSAKEELVSEHAARAMQNKK